MSEGLRQRLQAALGEAYVLERELSGGGMSRVFLGRDMMLGRQVVLKVLPPEAALPEPAARFRREAMLVARLQHPHILPVFGVGVVDDIQYFTMPYVEGGSLRTHLERHRHLPVDDARRVLSEIGDALACAHRQGIVHRDVKPENIFLERRTGRTLLADFGVALALGEPEGVTQSGTTVGTPAYMSPEQVDGRRLDGLSDIYSLGLVGWEMVTGQRPWSGESVYDVMYKQKHQPLPSLDSFNIDVEPHFVRAIERAVRKDPDERWPNAEAFVAALDPDQDRERRSHSHGWSTDAVETEAELFSSIEEDEVDAEPAMATEDAPTIVAHPRDHHRESYGNRRSASGMDSQEYEYRARVGWRSSMYGAREQRANGSSRMGRAVSVAAVLLVAAAAASATTAGRRVLMAPFSTAGVSGAPAPAAVADSPLAAVGQVPVPDVAATLTTSAPSTQPMPVKSVAAAPSVKIESRRAVAAAPAAPRVTQRAGHLHHEYADARPGRSVRARVATAELQLHSYERVMANESSPNAGAVSPPVTQMAAPRSEPVPVASAPQPVAAPVSVPSVAADPVVPPASRPTTPPAGGTESSDPPLAPAVPTASGADAGAAAAAPGASVPPADAPAASAKATAVRVPSRGSALTPGSGLGTSAAPAAAAPAASSSVPKAADDSSCRPAFPGSHVCRVYDPTTGQVVGYRYIPGQAPAPTP